MSFKLYLDDQLDDPDAPERHTPEGFLGARNVPEAIALIEEHGLPSFIDLDHDLRAEQDGMDFLKWLYATYPDIDPPDWNIHTKNVCEQEHMESYLSSWRKSRDL